LAQAHSPQGEAVAGPTQPEADPESAPLGAMAAVQADESFGHDINSDDCGARLTRMESWSTACSTSLGCGDEGQKPGELGGSPATGRGGDDEPEEHVHRDAFRRPKYERCIGPAAWTEIFRDVDDEVLARYLPEAFEGDDALLGGPGFLRPRRSGGQPAPGQGADGDRQAFRLGGARTHVGFSLAHGGWQPGQGEEGHQLASRFKCLRLNTDVSPAQGCQQSSVPTTSAPGRPGRTLSRSKARVASSSGSEAVVPCKPKGPPPAHLRGRAPRACNDAAGVNGRAGALHVVPAAMPGVAA